MFKDLTPKLFDVLKGYSKNQLMKDIISGIIVAVIALPLSIALAIASGVRPECGLYTAIIAGFFISLLGGSRVQIGGPTAAFVIIIYGIVEKFGMNGLTIATIMAGIIMLLLAVLRLGSLIKFIPYTITTGFTLGIAVTLFIGQAKDFLGLDMGAVPSEFLEKIKAFAEVIQTTHLPTFAIGVLALLIIIFFPKITDKIPSTLIAIIVTTAIVAIFKLDVCTIGTLRGGAVNYEISSSLPTLSIPSIDFATIKDLIQPAFTIAILASIESLLSCVVSDGMIGSRHKSNAELVGQGVGNIMSGLFGGIPATGAIARTAANVKNGGRTPIAGMVHALTLLVILLVAMPLASLIPMPCLAAVLIVVAYNMSGWREFFALLKTSPKSDIIVLVITFGLTVFFDLVVAIEVGMVLAALLFMKRMADVSEVHGWKYKETAEDLNDPNSITLKQVPNNTLVYEINGPMFFGAADKFMDINPIAGKKIIILRMRNVPAMDITGLNRLKAVYEMCKKRGIQMIFSHVVEQPKSMMDKAKFTELIGEENFCANIDAALERAKTLKIK